MNKNLVIGLVAVLIVVIIGGTAVMWLIFSNNNSKTTNTNAVATLNLNTNSNISTNYADGTIGDILSDYTKKENWNKIIGCYLSTYPESILYFPDGKLREDYLSYTLEGAIDELVFCDYYGNDAFAYIENLLQTDADEDGVNAFLEGIYKASDESNDTDNDGYDDLTEIQGGYNPNDTIKETYKEVMSQVETILSQENPDTDSATTLCRELEPGVKESCFETVSRFVTDPTYCKTVGFDEYYASSIVNCENYVTQNIAARNNDPSLCESFGSYNSYCLQAVAESSGTLSPCEYLLDEGYGYEACISGVLREDGFVLIDENECNNSRIKNDKYDYELCLEKVKQ